MTKHSPGSKPKFCSECGVKLLADAAFCHNCGISSDARSGPIESTPRLSPVLRWGVPAAALFAFAVISTVRLGSRDPAQKSAAIPRGSRAMSAPDISSMSPAEQADRLFNRVMRLATDGKADSAAFFAPMAIAAFEALAPLSAHARYDLGLVALVSGDLATASAQSDTILSGRPTHLLGLSLAERVANARGDARAGKALRERILAADQAERATGLAEYTEHDVDIRAAMDSARSR